MLNCTLNQREDQFQNLNNFTEKTHAEIMDITSSLGWTIASIDTDNDTRLVCPFDSSHRIGKNMLDRHLESCQWKNEGYNKFDISLSEPSLSLHSPSSIKFDAPLQNDILQKAKQVDSSIKVETCECRTWHKLYISFFISFAKYLYNTHTMFSQFNLYLKCITPFKTIPNADNRYG